MAHPTAHEPREPHKKGSNWMSSRLPFHKHSATGRVDGYVHSIFDQAIGETSPSDQCLIVEAYRAAARCISPTQLYNAGLVQGVAAEQGLLAVHQLHVSHAYATALRLKPGGKGLRRPS